MQVLERASACSHRQLWNILCASKVPSRWGSWASTLPPALTCQPSTNGHLVSMGPVLDPPKTNQKLILEPKHTKALENATSDNIKALYTPFAFSSIISESQKKELLLVSRHSFFNFSFIWEYSWVMIIFFSFRYKWFSCTYTCIHKDSFPL